MTSLRHIRSCIRTRSGGVLLAIAVLAGCAPPGTNDRLDDLATRVERLARAEPTPAPVDLPVLPARRDRLVAVPAQRIGLTELVGILPCELLPLVAERNSALGRVQAASQRLLWERRMLFALDECRAQLPATLDADAVSLLDELRTAKRAGLEQHFWNMVWAGPEIEAMLSASNRGGSAATGEVAAALEWLGFLAGRLHDPAFEVTSGELESRLSTIRQAGPAGLPAQLARMEAALARVTAALDVTVAERLCPLGTPVPRATLFQNVFTEVYAVEVQPLLVREERAARSLLLHLARLAPAPLPAMRDYVATLDMTREGSAWRRYELARSRHTQAWQALFAHGGLAPGNTASR